MQRHRGRGRRDALKTVAVAPGLELSPVAAIGTGRVDRLGRARVPVCLVEQMCQLGVKRRRQLNWQIRSRLERQHELALERLSIRIARVFRQRNLNRISAVCGDKTEYRYKHSEGQTESCLRRSVLVGFFRFERSRSNVVERLWPADRSADSFGTRFWEGGHDLGVL